jgi:signal transduction histidine kinase
MSLTHQPPLPTDPLQTGLGAAAGEDGIARILVVDDQESNLDVIDTILMQPDCRLVRARSADEALLALLDHDVAVIILDIMMPGMNGLELAELIKQRRRTRDIPILFLTAHMVDEVDILRGYGTGAVDYLTKPIRPEILRSKVAVFVDLYRKTHALARANASLRREIAEREQLREALVQANLDLERRVRERTEALQRADRRKDEFLASLAHELRNPLAPIRSAAEVLEMEDIAKSDGDRARAVIVRQVEHMTRLIDDLLDVSRITIDKLVLQVDRIELGPVIAAAVETSRPLVTERAHQLRIELPAAPVSVDADPARLAQVLSNLLTNAAKYTPPGGEITVQGEVRNGELVLRIRDSGIGISADLLPRIFDLFTQGGQAHDRTAGGLGIGLTLARRLVEMHGGSLEAESGGPGRGSQFSVHLPVPTGPVAVTRVAAEAPPDLSVSKRILVVDDNEDAAQMLATMLGTWGQQTRVVYDGLAALAAAREFQPEIVLLDIGLPNLDGYDTARRLREEPWGAAITIIAVTGWGQNADLARSRLAGFNHHLVKPVSPRVLRGLIASS